MKVKLLRNWYTPSRKFFLAGVHDMPDGYKAALPKSAEILEEEEPEEEVETPVKKAAPKAKAGAD